MIDIGRKFNTQIDYRTRNYYNNTLGVEEEIALTCRIAWHDSVCMLTNLQYIECIMIMQI